jgi:Domain of unknown function (DUF4386)
MHPNNKTARLAGVLYLILVISGIFSLLYVPSQLIDLKDAVRTFANIQQNEVLYRVGIVAGVVCYTAFLLLPLALYKLLQPVNKSYAVAMVALAVVSVPFSLFNLMYKVNILTIMAQTEIDLIVRQVEVLQYLNYYNNGIQLISIFWGLWLFPFGYLLFKSGFFPKTLGIFLMLGCLGYVLDFLDGFLFSNAITSVIPIPLTVFASLGEIGSCFWLLIVGARRSMIAKG